jgi:hypothetical protein
MVLRKRTGRLASTSSASACEPLLVAGLASAQSGMREVVYQVDGTASYAMLTMTNKDGGKEQN